MKMLARVLKHEAGSTAMEYAFIASLISITAVAAMTAIGGTVRVRGPSTR